MIRIIKDIQLQVSGKTVCTAELVMILGVYFDTPLTIETQVNAICKTCHYNIYNIGHKEFCKTLAHTLITSSMDSVSALLYGLPKSGHQKVTAYNASYELRPLASSHLQVKVQDQQWQCEEGLTGLLVDFPGGGGGLAQSLYNILSLWQCDCITEHLSPGQCQNNWLVSAT